MYGTFVPGISYGEIHHETVTGEPCCIRMEDVLRSQEKKKKCASSYYFYTLVLCISAFAMVR